MNIKYKYVKTKVINNIETKIYFTTGSKKEYVYYKKKYIPIGDYKKIKLFKGGGDKEDRVKFLKQVKLFDNIIEDKPISSQELNVIPTVSATLGFQSIRSPKVSVKETTDETSLEILKKLLLEREQNLKIATSQNSKNSSLMSRVTSYRTVNYTNRKSRTQLMTYYNVIYKEFILPYLDIKKFITLLANFNSFPTIAINTQYNDAIANLQSLKQKFESIPEINSVLDNLLKEIKNKLENVQIYDNITIQTHPDIQTAYNNFLLIIKEHKELSIDLAKILKNIKESISTFDVIDKNLKQTLKIYLLPYFITNLNDIDNLLKIVNIAVKCKIDLTLSLDNTIFKDKINTLSNVNIEKFKDIKSLISMCSSKHQIDLFKLLNERIKQIIINEDIKFLTKENITKLFSFYELLIESETDGKNIIFDDALTEITNKIIELYLTNILDIDSNQHLLNIIKEYNKKYNNQLCNNINQQINNTESNLKLFKLILLLRHLNDDSINKHLIKLITYITTNQPNTQTLVDAIYNYNSIKINLKPEIQTTITQLIINKIKEENTIEQIINKNINTLLLLLYVFNPVEVGNQITLIIAKYNSETMEDKEELYQQVTILKSKKKFYSNTIIDIFQQELINYIKILRYNEYKKTICDTTINKSIKDKCYNNKLEKISTQDISEKLIDITNVITILKQPKSLKFESSKSELPKPGSPEYKNTIIENLIILLCNSDLKGANKNTIDISKIPQEIPTNSLPEDYVEKLEKIKYFQCEELNLDYISTKLQLTDLITHTSFDIESDGKPFITGIQNSPITYTYREDTIKKLKRNQGNIIHPFLKKKIVLNKENTTLVDIIDRINTEIIAIFPLQPIIKNIDKLKSETIKRLKYYGSDNNDELLLYDNLKKLSSFITMFDVSPHLGNAGSANRASHSGRASSLKT